MYHFTKLAIELNEEDESVAPTDSRRRPDQRLMERGLWEEANRVKSEVEDRQRVVRKKREADVENAMAEGIAYYCYYFFNPYKIIIGRPCPEYAPLWFEKTQDEYTGAVIHVFKNEYWDCKNKGDWNRCPNLW